MVGQFWMPIDSDVRDALVKAVEECVGESVAG
jgi:hypothetical protein